MNMQISEIFYRKIAFSDFCGFETFENLPLILFFDPPTLVFAILLIKWVWLGIGEAIGNMNSPPLAMSQGPDYQKLDCQIQQLPAKMKSSISDLISIMYFAEFYTKRISLHLWPL